MHRKTSFYRKLRPFTLGMIPFAAARGIAIAIIFVAFIGASELAVAEEDATYNPASFRQTVKAGMSSCAERIGYDPNAAIEETSLGENERAWRNCVYEVIEERILPRTRVPNKYENLIAEDRAMTDAIEEGRLARSQRRSRLQELANEISAAEAAQIAASDSRVEEIEAQEQTEFVRRMVNGLR